MVKNIGFCVRLKKLYADALKNSVGGYSLSEYKQKIKGVKIKTGKK